MRALLIAVGASDARTVRTVLTSPAHRVEEVNDTSEAVEALGREPAQIVVVGRHLPHGSAAEDCRRLRATCEPTIVVLTGGETPDVAEAAREADVLVQSADPRVVESLLRVAERLAAGRAKARACEDRLERVSNGGVEAELRKVSAFLDSIVENIPLMIFVKEAQQLRFERLNRAGEELIGIRREELYGKNDYDLFPREQAEFFQIKDFETLRLRTVIDIAEEPLQTAQGERWLHTKKITIADEQGAPRYLLGISEDITERRELETALRKLRDELERRVEERTAELVQANADLRREVADRTRAEESLHQTEEQLRQAQKMDAVGKLAGGIAHDFNNLLCVILGHAQMALRHTVPGDRTRETFLEIEEAGKRAAELTRQLLAFSRQQVMKPQVVDLNDVVRGMDNMLRRLLGEDIDLQTFPRRGLWKVMADLGQMEQVVMNLAVNARDAMPAGGKLTIETENVEFDEEVLAQHVGMAKGPHVMLAVSDNGTGMDSATLARVFEPFFTTKGVGKGTGLGLSTVFGIVKQSGGNVWVYSEPGNGATFKIYLPRAEERRSAQAPTSTHAPRRAGTETVLLVEDDAQVNRLVASILRQDGYDVFDVQSAAAALVVGEQHGGGIQLLLTDVVMPKMSGGELAERLKKARPEMKVVFMSGYTENVVSHRGVLDVGVEFIQKPIVPDTLLTKIREVLDAPKR